MSKKTYNILFVVGEKTKEEIKKGYESELLSKGATITYVDSEEDARKTFFTKYPHTAIVETQQFSSFYNQVKKQQDFDEVPPGIIVAQYDHVDTLNMVNCICGSIEDKLRPNLYVNLEKIITKEHITHPIHFIGTQEQFDKIDTKRTEHILKKNKSGYYIFLTGTILENNENPKNKEIFDLFESEEIVLIDKKTYPEMYKQAIAHYGKNKVIDCKFE